MNGREINYRPLTALEIDEINRTTPDLTPEEQEIHDKVMQELYEDKEIEND